MLTPSNAPIRVPGSGSIRLNLSLLLSALGWTCLSLAILLPTIVFVARAVLAFEAPAEGFTITSRQALLLAKTAGLALLATALALIVAIPPAYVIGQVGRLGRASLFTILAASPLLFPPSVYVFGWQRVLPPVVPGWIACVGIWALWAFPIPALLIGSGWARVGRTAFEAALLDAAPMTALHRLVLPVLSPHVSVAGLLLFVLFMSDYGVPHACALTVYSTEVLGWALNSDRAIDTLWPALPGIASVMSALLLALWIWRGAAANDADPGGEATGQAAPPSAVVLSGLVIGVAVGVPVGALVLRLTSLAPMRAAVETYGRELAESLTIATSAGLVAIGTGVWVSASTRLGRVALVWALAFGALPGALVGEALIATYLSFAVVYESALIVLLGYVARFGWIALIVAQAAMRATAEECVCQARTDGADETAIALHVRAPAAWPALAFGVLLVAALSLAEIPTSSLVQVPSLGLISQILIEKFHKAEEGMLISLSLWLVLAAIPAAVLGMWIMLGIRPHSRRTTGHKTPLSSLGRPLPTVGPRSGGDL